MFFNTHTHLNSDDLYEEREQLIKNCFEKNVTETTVVGYDLASSKRAVALAHEYECIHATVGISPNDCEDYSEEAFKEIAVLARDEEVVAIGEIGLDYYYDTDKKLQKRVFNKHLELAKELDLPIVIHCRDAYEDCYNMLKESGCKGIMHCYSGSDQMAMRFVQLGFYISLAGPVTFKNAKMPKLVAKNVPLDKLLIETDDPYMAPVPLRGTRNEPANVVYIAEKIAELKECSIAEVERQTFDNAKDIFHI